MSKVSLLAPYREKIDQIDDEIIDLLILRQSVIKTVGELKYREDIPAVLQDRVDEVRERAAKRAEKAGLDPELIRQIYTLLIDYSCDLEEVIKSELESKAGSNAA
jgi:chorismate mutase